MAVPIPVILGGLKALKDVAGIFRKKKGGEKTKVEEALDLVDNFVHTDVPSDAELQKALIEKDIEMEKAYTERAKMALEVINTEAASEDAYVRRARPTWLYMGVVVMVAQMVVMPFYGIKLSDFIDSQSLNWFYTVIGSGYLGYGVLRTLDKNNGNGNGIK